MEPQEREALAIQLAEGVSYGTFVQRFTRHRREQPLAPADAMIVACLAADRVNSPNMDWLKTLISNDLRNVVQGIGAFWSQGRRPSDTAIPTWRIAENRKSHFQALCLASLYLSEEVTNMT